EDLLDPEGRSRELRPVLEETVPPAEEREDWQGTLDEAFEETPAAKSPEPARAETPDPGPEQADDDTTEIPKVPAASSNGRRKGRKNHPVVPAWEDVLLGVKSQRGLVNAGAARPARAAGAARRAAPPRSDPRVGRFRRLPRRP